MTIRTRRTPDAVRAYAVLDFIRAHPELHDQEIWLRKTDCGTAGCFAGLACWLNGDTPIFEGGPGSSVVRSADTRRQVQIRNRAIGLLGLSPTQADLLFDAGNSLEDLISEVEQIFGERPAA